MDKNEYQLAIIFKYKMNRVNGDFDKLKTYRFNKWLFENSKERKLNVDEKRPKFDDNGNLLNGSFSGKDKYGNELTFDQFRTIEIRDIINFDADFLGDEELHFLSNYRFFLDDIHDQSSTLEYSKKFKKYCRIGALFAQGFIKEKRGVFYFKDETFRVASDFHERLCREIKEVFNIEIIPGSIKPYISDTFNGKDTNKNFHKNKNTHRKTIEFCEAHNIPITENFRDILNN